MIRFLSRPSTALRFKLSGGWRLREEEGRLGGSSRAIFGNRDRGRWWPEELFLG